MNGQMFPLLERLAALVTDVVPHLWGREPQTNMKKMKITLFCETLNSSLPDPTPALHKHPVVLVLVAS